MGGRSVPALALGPFPTCGGPSLQDLVLTGAVSLACGAHGWPPPGGAAAPPAAPGPPPPAGIGACSPAEAARESPCGPEGSRTALGTRHPAGLPGLMQGDRAEGTRKGTETWRRAQTDPGVGLGSGGLA